MTAPYSVTDVGGWRGHGDTHTVVQASYHRNGVGGAGFYVALIDTLHKDEGEQPRRYLLTWFPTYDAEGETLLRYQDHVAVVAVDEVAKDNVAMHPLTDPVTKQPIEGTGGNAWRGADNWGLVLPLVEQWASDAGDAAMERFRAEQAAR